MTPKRIKRETYEGWKMPEGSIFVGRPSKYANYFSVINGHKQGFLIYDDNPPSVGGGYIRSFKGREQAIKESLKMFRARIIRKRLNLGELYGKDLVCYCELSAPCHADILLQLANRE